MLAFVARCPVERCARYCTSSDSNMREDFQSLGIAARANGRVEQRLPCPQCAKNSRDTALSVNVEDGRFHCFRCGWKGRAGDPQLRNLPPRIARIDDPAVAQRKRERLRQTWKESVPLSHSKAQAV